MHGSTSGLEQEGQRLQERLREAAQALAGSSAPPCRGQVYSYTRNERTYFKWQRCEAGRRVQRTVSVAAAEHLEAGIRARKWFEARIKAVYEAGEALLLAEAAAELEAPTAGQKKGR